jgi:hypothetical protein
MNVTDKGPGSPPRVHHGSIGRGVLLCALPSNQEATLLRAGCALTSSCLAARLRVRP